MTPRAEAAAATADRIAASTEALLASDAVSAVTLQAIAARAEVTVQTVLRHMGSREGCLEAAWRRVGARVEAHRGVGTPGDVASCLAGLLDHYEADGRLVLNLLAQESGDPLAREVVTVGRAFHRAWVLRCFASRVPASKRELVVDALSAATDLYVWKLLRLDLGRSAPEVAAVIHRLVEAVLEQP